MTSAVLPSPETPILIDLSLQETIDRFFEATRSLSLIQGGSTQEIRLAEEKVCIDSRSAFTTFKRVTRHASGNERNAPVNALASVLKEALRLLTPGTKFCAAVEERLHDVECSRAEGLAPA